MLRMILMIFSLVASISVNIIAHSVPLNGQTTGEITNRLPVLFNPASYVFSLWLVIYLLFAIWIYGFSKNKWNTSNSLRNRRAFLFITINLVTIAWILSWHYLLFTWTIVSLIALLFATQILYFTYPKREARMQGRIPVAVYFGWAILSTISVISYVLTLHEWSGWGLSTPLWTVIYLTIAAAVSLHFLVHHADIALNSVFIWFFIGIAVKNGADELFVSAVAIFLVVVIAVCIYLTKKNR